MKKYLTLTLLICTLVLACLALPAWFIMALMSVMIFDSGIHFLGLLFVGSTWLYPLFLLIFIWQSWRCYFKQKYLKAIAFSVIAILPAFIAWLLVFHDDLRFWMPWYLFS